ncbi:MAG: uracil-DNA glycosylase [Gammaproteobacteria bacterium]
MSEETRLQYLEAMGIQVWTLRQPTGPEPVSSQEPDPETPVAVEPARLDRATNQETEWERLKAEVAVCRKCGLCEGRTQAVFGTGDERADWMIIGEAPGKSEDERGEPFVGRAGQLLTEMLRAIGLSREKVFITNIVKCRPPNNRDPRPDEVEACFGYLERQIAWIKPKIILAVGRIAAQSLLKTDQPLSKLRGSVHHLDDTPVVVIYHPAYLLRSLLEKRKAWDDLQLALATFNAMKG